MHFLHLQGKVCVYVSETDAECSDGLEKDLIFHKENSTQVNFWVKYEKFNVLGYALCYKKGDPKDEYCLVFPIDSKSLYI